MAGEESKHSTDLTTADMRHWLREEKATLKLAMERRIKEATEFVEAYSRGQISAQEANDKFGAYIRRWPDYVSNDTEVQDDIERTAKTITHRGYSSRS